MRDRQEEERARVQEEERKTAALVNKKPGKRKGTVKCTAGNEEGGWLRYGGRGERGTVSGRRAAEVVVGDGKEKGEATTQRGTKKGCKSGHGSSGGRELVRRVEEQKGAVRIGAAEEGGKEFL